MSEKSLEIKNLTKRIGKKTILDGIDLDVEKGQIVGLIGPNGAGKTTTFKCCSGLCSISSGEVLIGGYSLKNSYEKAMGKLAYSYGCDNFYPFFDARENVRALLPLKKHTNGEIEKALSLVGLENVMQKKIKTYSLGMKQRLSLAIAFIDHPEVVMLDEPFNGVDPQGVIDFRDIIKQQRSEYGTTFIISSHNLSEISKVIDSHVFIKRGKIVTSECDNYDCKIYTLTLRDLVPFVDYLKNKGFNFSVNENKVTFMMPSSGINNVLRALAELGVVVQDISVETPLEKEYMEVLGGEKIE